MGIGELGLPKAVFLDRDGVISPPVGLDEFGGTESPLRFEDFQIFPWTAKAVKLLNGLGYYVFVATNQPAVAKEKMTIMELKKNQEILPKFESFLKI